MRFNPGEQALLAYFRTEGEARAASESLRAAGFAPVQVDRVSRYGEATDPEGDSPAAGKAVNLSSVTLYGRGDNLSIEVGKDAGVLLAGHPSVSGLAGAGGDLAGGLNYLVTVVAPEDRLGEARTIARRHGGLV